MENPAEHIFELPDERYIGDMELDRVIDHARRYQRCLFKVGEKLIELVLNEDDTIGVRLDVRL